MSDTPRVGDIVAPDRVCFCSGNDHQGPPRGFYPMITGTEPDFDLRLRWVDDAPDNPEDFRGHFEVMPREAGYGYFHGARSSENPLPEGEVVALTADVRGKASAGARIARRAKTVIRYIIGGNQ